MGGGVMDLDDFDNLDGPTRQAQPPKLPKRDVPKSKVKVRDLGTRGVRDTDHTSFRFEPEVKARLRKLAKRKYGGITMSACLRILINEACDKEGIK